MDAPHRTIVHVDMDAFYAAIEQRDRPELQGQPVIIAHTGPRGVVSTASYEARTFGVRSAMPSTRALQLCPHGIYIEPRISYYAEVSREIFSVFASITPEIEGLSLDEAFLDVSASLQLFGSALRIGERIRHEVRQRTALNCSVGIAHNKLLAKMASELCKPNGLLLLSPEQVQMRLDPLPVGRLYTIGKVANAKLAEHHIHTIGQLRRAPLARVRAALGNHAELAQQFARGEDTRAVQSERLDQSMGAETTFSEDLQDLGEVRMRLMRSCEKVAARLRAHNKVAQTLTVKLRLPPFETLTRQGPLTPPANSTDALFHRAESLLVAWWQGQKQPSLRLLGVSASRLVDPGQTLGKAAANAPMQADLFAPTNSRSSPVPESPAAPQRDQLTDAINRKFGGGSLQRARGLRGQKSQDPQ